MAVAIAQHRRNCESPFRFDEKPMLISGGSAGERAVRSPKESDLPRIVKIVMSDPSHTLSGGPSGRTSPAIFHVSRQLLLHESYNSQAEPIYAKLSTKSLP